MVMVLQIALIRLTIENHGPLPKNPQVAILENKMT